MRFVLPLLLSFAACGGRFDAAGSSPQDDGGTTGDGGTTDGSTTGDAGTDTSAPTGIEGSYDLSFTKVDVTSSGQNGKPPSEGHAFRFDLRTDPSGAYVAVVTPRWGESAHFAVDVQPTAIRLSGKGDYRAGATNDTWESFTLARDATGAISGSFTATGSEMTSNGDVVFTGKLSGQGTLARDATAPELQISGTSPAGPDGQLLPWDAVIVRAAEPVTVARISDVRLAGAAGDLPLTWAPPDPVEWEGEVQLTAWRTSWTGKGTDAKLSAPDQLARDLVGLGTAGVAQPLPFVDVPPPLKIHNFDGDSVTVTLWGGAKLLGSDPICENGGCVELEFSAGYCNVPRIGLAARLDAAGASTVKLRYRVLAKDMGGAAPTYLPPVFTIDVASLGGLAQHFPQTVDAKGLAKLASPIGAYAYATDWASAGAPIPTSAAEAGVAIYAGNGPLGPDCGFVPAPVPVALVIDVVNAQ